MNIQFDSNLVDELAEEVHADWMRAKQDDGITSRPSADGVEQMVPYEHLPEHIKELDRVTVRAVLRALNARGYHVVLDVSTL